MKGESISKLITEENRDIVIEQNRLEMFESLMISAERAALSKQILKDKIIKGMTVVELIDELAQRNIRFFYKPASTENFSGGGYR